MPQHGEYARYNKSWENITIAGGEPEPGEEQISVEIVNKDNIQGLTFTGAGSHTVGSTVTVTANYTGGDLDFENWLKEVEGEWTPIPGASNETYTFTAAENVRLATSWSMG